MNSLLVLSVRQVAGTGGEIAISIRRKLLKHIVLYHADCSDGFGAAWAAWKHLGKDASYIPMEYGTGPPSLHRNAHVYVLDFTFPRDVIGDMHDHCKELVIIDHHGTTAKELAGLPYVVFDEKKAQRFWPGSTSIRVRLSLSSCFTSWTVTFGSSGSRRVAKSSRSGLLSNGLPGVGPPPTLRSCQRG